MPPGRIYDRRHPDAFVPLYPYARYINYYRGKRVSVFFSWQPLSTIDRVDFERWSSKQNSITPQQVLAANVMTSYSCIVCVCVFCIILLMSSPPLPPPSLPPTPTSINSIYSGRRRHVVAHWPTSNPAGGPGRVSNLSSESVPVPLALFLYKLIGGPSSANGGWTPIGTFSRRAGSRIPWPLNCL